MLIELRDHVFAGVTCLALAATWVAFADWPGAMSQSVVERMAMGAGFFMSAAPLLICVSIGALARGEQKGPSFREDVRD